MPYNFDVKRVDGVITITVDDLGAHVLADALVLEGWEALEDGDPHRVDFTLFLGKAIDEYLAAEDATEDA